MLSCVSYSNFYEYGCVYMAIKVHDGCNMAVSEFLLHCIAIYNIENYGKIFSINLSQQIEFNLIIN